MRRMLEAGRILQEFKMLTINERLNLLEWKLTAIQSNINDVKDLVERIYNRIGFDHELSCVEDWPVSPFIIGQTAYRKTSNYVADEWKEFIVNETYLDLISEFPEDYKKHRPNPMDLSI